MDFETEDDAKNYSIGITSKKLDRDESKIRLNSYKKYYKNAFDDKSKQYWQNEIQGL